MDQLEIRIRAVLNQTPQKSFTIEELRELMMDESVRRLQPKLATLAKYGFIKRVSWGRYASLRYKE